MNNEDKWYYKGKYYDTEQEFHEGVSEYKMRKMKWEDFERELKPVISAWKINMEIYEKDYNIKGYELEKFLDEILHKGISLIFKHKI